MIAAVALNGVIGRDNGLPWRLPSDLKWFKSITMGKPIIMGRRTHESIGRALPGRHNIVVTRNTGYRSAGCTIVHSVNDALESAGRSGEVVIIGGAQLYRELFPRAGRLYLTLIDREFEGDTYFPKFDMSEWLEVSNEPVARTENCRRTRVGFTLRTISDDVFDFGPPPPHTSQLESDRKLAFLLGLAPTFTCPVLPLETAKSPKCRTSLKNVSDKSV